MWTWKGEGVKGRGVSQISILLHKPYLVKWSAKEGGVINVQKTVHMVYGWPLRGLPTCAWTILEGPNRSKMVLLEIQHQINLWTENPFRKENHKFNLAMGHEWNIALVSSGSTGCFILKCFFFWRAPVTKL